MSFPLSEVFTLLESQKLPQWSQKDIVLLLLFGLLVIKFYHYFLSEANCTSAMNIDVAIQSLDRPRAIKILSSNSMCNSLIKVMNTRCLLHPRCSAERACLTTVSAG